MKPETLRKTAHWGAALGAITGGSLLYAGNEVNTSAEARVEQAAEARGIDTSRPSRALTLLREEEGFRISGSPRVVEWGPGDTTAITGLCMLSIVGVGELIAYSDRRRSRSRSSRSPQNGGAPAAIPNGESSVPPIV